MLGWARYMLLLVPLLGGCLRITTSTIVMSPTSVNVEAHSEDAGGALHWAEMRAAELAVQAGYPGFVIKNHKSQDVWGAKFVSDGVAADGTCDGHWEDVLIRYVDIRVEFVLHYEPGALSVHELLMPVKGKWAYLEGKTAKALERVPELEKDSPAGGG